MTPKDVQSLLEDHDRYWERKQDEQERLRDIYETRFYDQPDAEDGQIQVQTSDAFGHVESYVGQLYAKNPACVVRPGMRKLGNAELSQRIANQFLSEHARDAVEHASRLGLIHPMGWLKLVPCESNDVYEMLLPVAVPPWEVIVDMDAPSWVKSRYVGHVYWMPLTEAKETWGSKRKWLAREKGDYFRRDAAEDNSARTRPTVPVTKFDKYVRIVEFYDFTDNKLYFWTPDMEGDNRFIDKGDIPFKSWNGRPISTLVPFIFSTMPHKPMEGYSTLRRVYDQLYEKNIVRSYQASAVRKVARQYLMRAGAFDEEGQGHVRSGIDGLFISVELDPGERLTEVVAPMPHTPLPAETSRYVDEVMSDQHSSTNQDPFARGQGLGGRASAAEVAALVSYSASGLGNMARKRDAAIEELVRVYLAAMSTFVDNKTVPVDLDGASVVAQPSDLLGDFKVFAEDEGQTPVSEAMRQQQFLMNVPTLQALGASREWLLEQAGVFLGFDEIPSEPPPPEAPVGPLDAGQPSGSPGEAVASAGPEDIAGMMGDL